MRDGSVAEIATVGSEGMLGAGVFFGDDLSTGEALVQVSDGEAHTMPADAFIQEMERRGDFYNRITRYSQAFTTQIMQTTVCNGLHSAEERCCRWLLMTHDRVRQHEFGLTHEVSRRHAGCAASHRHLNRREAAGRRIDFVSAWIHHDRRSTRPGEGVV